MVELMDSKLVYFVQHAYSRYTLQKSFVLIQLPESEQCSCALHGQIEGLTTILLHTISTFQQNIAEVIYSNSIN